MFWVRHAISSVPLADSSFIVTILRRCASCRLWLLLSICHHHVTRIDDAIQEAEKLAGPPASGFAQIVAKNATWGDRARKVMGPTNWKGSEFGWEDKFFSNYIGRFNGGDTGTEVTSMGLQALFENPLRFLRDDPEIFELIVNLARGRYDFVDEMAFMKRVAKIDAPARINSLDKKNRYLPYHK
ncbi:MAG: hypothetical protein QGH33_11475 [Pirellulaceae bacterium]|jgi:hypothetical protein|nr:hypothetical protein [Pirellulaceae bacterium]